MSAVFYSNNVNQEWEYWYPRVYGYFYKRIDNKSAVEDLTSETINTVFLAENIKNFKAYLWKVAHNYLVRYINTKQTDLMLVNWDESLDLANSVQPNFSIEEGVENTRSQNYLRLKEQMLKCFNHHITNQMDKQIVNLSIIQEKNSSQIATELNLKADNIRQKLSRTLKKVKSKCIQIWNEFNTN